jgi:hypothetical protein
MDYLRKGDFPLEYAIGAKKYRKSVAQGYHSRAAFAM